MTAAHSPLVDAASSSRLAPPAGARPAEPRLVYVDNLRVLVVLGVLVVHLGEVFNPWDEWHVQNPERSRVIGESAVLFAPWIMPLMMLLAGVSAWYSLQRRGNAGYLGERVRRVLLPLLVGVPVLVAPQVWLERRLHGEFTGSFWAFVPRFFDGLYPEGNLSWHHLWFLAHLFLYSVVALPIFRYWQGERGGVRMRWLARLCSGPGGLFWLAVPLVLERHLLWGLFPERHMLASDWSNHAMLFVAYLYGFVLAGERWLGERIDAEWPWALGTALVTMGALMAAAWHGLVPWRIPQPYSPGYLAFWTVYALCAWSWMVALLGLGRRWLRAEAPFLGFAGRRAYLWYLVHQTVIVAVAYFVVRWDAPVALKYVVLAGLSVAGTLAVTEALYRLPRLRRRPARGARDA